MAGQHHHGEAVAREGGRAVKRPDTPFPRHWLYYIAVKIAVIVAAALIALYFLGFLQAQQ